MTKLAVERQWNSRMPTYLEQFVETVGCLLYEHLPTAVVVVTPRQSHHSHLVNQRVGADDVVALVRILFHHRLPPRRLARARQTNDHYHLPT